MTEVPVTELLRLPLHYAVGLANGWITYPSDSIERGAVFHKNPATAPFDQTEYVMSYCPSSDSYEAWRILRESKVTLSCVLDGDPTHPGGVWKAEKGDHCMFHEDPVIAMLRCHVADKFGPVVSIPDYMLEVEGPERGISF